MPIYEYICNKCGQQTEFFESYAKKTKRTCSHCGSTQMKKLISTFAAQIKAGESKKCYGCTDFKCPHSNR